VRSSSPWLRKYAAPPFGWALLSRHRPVLWAYWPRRIEARDGQHRGVVSKALVKLVPLGTHAECSVERSKTELSKSSARMSTTLGLSPGGEGVCPPSPQEEGASAIATKTVASSVPLSITLPIRKGLLKDMPWEGRSIAKLRDW
jgi:hypothetical protein